MSRSKASLKVAIDPVRKRHLNKFKTELKAYLAEKHVCETEIIRRDEKGVVIRDGVLNLPSRCDFMCISDDSKTLLDIQTVQTVDFKPVDVQVDDKLDLTIFPFSWDEVQISFDTGDDPKRLLRLRLWYLEWFQSRKTENDSGLDGCLHSLRGPKRDGDIWHVCIDMGSAPTEALTELFHVMASRGVNRMTLGAELDRVENEQI